MQDNKGIYFSKVIEKIQTTINEHNMLEFGETVIVALSGGSDSMCLLDSLKYLSKTNKYNIIACHINHKLRGNQSDNDMVFVREYCKKRDISFLSKSVDVNSYSKSHKKSIEESARILRYEFLFEVAQDNCAKIATAHHMQDQTETVIMNLIRGAGTLGISGMDYLGNNVIHPLLDISKDEINKYIIEQEIPYCIDETNSIPCTTRNKIRIEIVPFIERILDVDLSSKINKTSFLCREDEKYINSHVKKIINELNIKTSIDCEYLNSLPFAIASRLVRTLYENAKGNLKNLSFVHTNDLLSLSKRNINGKSINISDGLVGIINEEKLLILPFQKLESSRQLQKKFIEEIENIVIPFKVPHKYEFEQINISISTGFVEKEDNLVYNAKTWYLPYEKVKDAQFRFKREKDTIRPNNNSGKKTLKKYFIDKKIPQERKNQLLLLAKGNEVLWIEGMKGVLYPKLDDEILIYIKIETKI